MAGLGFKRRRWRAGFTLLELLLTLVLLLALLGATVFSFSSLRRRAALDEGVDRLQTLFRFARAHAATAGRVVEVALRMESEAVEAVVVEGVPPTPSLEVLWEPDPSGQPGRFVPLPEPLPGVAELEDLVAVREATVQPAGAVPVPMADPTGATLGGPQGSVGSPGSGLLDGGVGEDAGIEPAIARVRFFPDGSSDSARVMLASRDIEDLRLARVELIGITGLSRVSWLSGDTNSGALPTDDAWEEAAEELDSGPDALSRQGGSGPGLPP